MDALLPMQQRSGLRALEKLFFAIILQRYRKMNTYSGKLYRNEIEFYKELTKLWERLNIPNTHTPHDCRHTFSWLCDKYGVDMFTKKVLMGHSLGTSVTENTYGHRNLEELRTELEKTCH